jgi:hypothetical protein
MLRFVCIPMLFKSRNLLQMKTKMQNVDQNLIFFLLFNGALGFAVNRIVDAREMTKLFPETGLQSTCNFSINDSTYKKNKCTFRNSVKYGSGNNIKIQHLLCICT